MGQEHGAEATPVECPVPAPTDGGRHPRAADLPHPFDAAPKGTAAEDVSRHENTAAGDLAFLTRYAFGGY